MALLWGASAVSLLLLRPFWLALALFMPACPFRAITGVPCPTCGTTHAAVALLHGHVGAALAANPLATMAGMMFLAGGMVAPIWVAFSWPLPEIPMPPPWARAAIAVAVLAGWAYAVVRG